MKKRVTGVLLSLCMVLTLFPASALATEDSGATEVEPPTCTCEEACAADALNPDCPVCGAEGATPDHCGRYVASEPEATTEPELQPEEPTCICEAACAADALNPDCPVCGAEGATAERCGKYVAPEEETEPELTAVERVQAMLDALPTVAELEGADEATVNAAYETAQKVYDALEALSPEEQEQITGVEKLTALMDWLNGQVSTPETASTGWTALTSSDTSLSDGQYFLDDDITINSTLEINGTVILDLNGHVLYKNRSGSHIIQVNTGGSLTLKDSNNTATHTDTTLPVGGVITTGWMGGGVSVVSNGSFTMEGGTIFNCLASNLGGGVSVNDNSTFTMNGGAISNCSTDSPGGGVYVAENSIFTMNGGAISNCWAYSGGGGGVWVGLSSTFTMNGGTLSDCSAETNLGNGVCVGASGTFTMKDGTISNHIYISTGSSNKGKFYANGGTVYGNVSNWGVISNTSATGSATICYGTLECYSDSENKGTLSGPLVEFQNGEELYAWEVLKAGGKAVQPTDPPAAEGWDFDGWYQEQTLETKWKFTTAVDQNRKLYSRSMERINLTQDTISNYLDGKTLKTGSYRLDGDIIPNSTLEINGTVILDLNGHVLKDKNDAAYRMIKINTGGSLTLKDSNNTATHTDTTLPVGGVITDAHGNFGGGVYVASNGSFTMEGGTIFNCSAYNTGGGVSVNDNSTFTMNGGAISNCLAEGTGGGVYVAENSIFTMNGGTISNCSVYSNREGGGVTVLRNSTFTMNGGTISDCSAGTHLSDGVYVGTSGTFTMKDGTISNHICISTGSSNKGKFYANGGTVYGNVSNWGVISNTSATGSATICYGTLECYSDSENKGTLSGPLVEFQNGEELYAWEVLKAGGKAVQPTDPPAAEGWDFDGWYQEQTLETKWEFTTAVNQNRKLYSNFVERITLTVPFTTEVRLGDSGVPDKTEFDLAIVHANTGEDHSADVTVSGTVTTNGAGTYNGTLTLTGTFTELWDLLCEGAFVQQVNDGKENWTYDDSVWALLLDQGASTYSLDEANDEALSVLIYPASCEKSEDAPYYSFAGNSPVRQMTFTNIYTKHAHQYTQAYDEKEHWDECTCGDTQNQEAHKYGEWKVTKEATASAKGKKERICSICGYCETAELAVGENGNPSEGAGDENTKPSKATEAGNSDAAKTDVPQTGDNSNTTWWFTLLVISAAGIIGLVLYGKKRNHSAK